jgi:hypothetical protein
MSPGDPLRLERKVANGILFVLYALLAAALLVMLVTYVRSPRSWPLPAWLSVGFPLALCIGVVHFGRRTWQSWRRFRRR